MPIQYGGAGQVPILGAIQTTEITLQAGAVWPVPSGRWSIKPGKFTSFQEYDPVTGLYLSIGAGSTSAPQEIVFSDGTNYRLANQTGCCVGALLTVAGTGYTSVPTVTVDGTGGAILKAIVGGAVNTSVTVSNGGANYTYPPMVIFSAPPPGGIPASGYCTLSAGAVSTVTISNQGAGYSSPPTITFQNDPREGLNGISVGYNAAAVCVLTGAQTITGIIVVDHGKPVTAVPTITVSGGGGASGAATAIMCWSITAYTVSATTAGSGYVAPVIVSAYGGFPATSPAYTNTATQANLVKTRAASILAALSTGAITATGQTVFDGGVYAGTPTVYVQSSNVPGAGAVAAVFTTPTMGGVVDSSFIAPT